MQGAALQPPDGRAGHREHGRVLPQPGQAGEQPKLPWVFPGPPCWALTSPAAVSASAQLLTCVLLLLFPFPGLTALVFLSESHWKNPFTLSCLFPVLNHFTLPSFQLFHTVLLLLSSVSTLPPALPLKGEGAGGSCGGKEQL